MYQRNRPTIYLRESRARRFYSCASCQDLIHKHAPYYRDEPHPHDRMKYGFEVRHLCVDCAAKIVQDGDIIIPKMLHVKRQSNSWTQDKEEQLTLNLVAPPTKTKTVQLFDIPSDLLQRLQLNYDEIYNITPEAFEILVCDRLDAMGFDALRVGHTYAKDGGVDIVFAPKYSPVPFLGAAQVKHRRNPGRSTGPAAVRELSGIIQPSFNLGMVITNTAFTPDAKWCAAQRSTLVRLRDMEHLRRWIADDFISEAEWRELPRTIQLCPGVELNIEVITNPMRAIVR